MVHKNKWNDIFSIKYEYNFWKKKRILIVENYKIHNNKVCLIKFQCTGNFVEFHQILINFTEL